MNIEHGSGLNTMNGTERVGAAGNEQTSYEKHRATMRGGRHARGRVECRDCKPDCGAPLSVGARGFLEESAPQRTAYAEQTRNLVLTQVHSQDCQPPIHVVPNVWLRSIEWTEYLYVNL